MPATESLCPSCGNTSFHEVLRLRDCPASGLFRGSSAERVSLHELAFDVCGCCGLLRNRGYSSPPEYTEKPRPTDRQLPAYRDRLFKRIADVADKGDLIAEIGANDGTFLDLLREHGYLNTYGVEPSEELVKRSREKGHRIVAEYFGPDIVEALLASFGSPKLIVCRHTLEHVPNPDSFVQALRALLSSGTGTALVEVPDSTAIPEAVNFVELWDEHLFYFTPNTLRLLMQRHGLEVVSEQVLPHLASRNIVMEVIASDSHARSETQAVSAREVALWRSFGNRFQGQSEQIRNLIREVPKPIYLIGASHPQCNFVNYLGIAPLVDFMIDDDPVKLGKLPSIASDKVRIVSSEEFSRHAQGGSLVLTGFGYESWTRKLCDLAGSKGMTIVDPAAVAS